ncbi:DNA-binding FadR family transcriptional regulator [Microterricola gilva]|uniref:DNA-binding FadR family transcriptional regulator n=1 Tax=Microterricola gilva TaxID=393267 RepID=A0A4Q8AQ91_9MICO|nr:FCD domain-containing protein [Microterricola gilva]RZU66817.1 DNA-binding FadR family transcriptional regulator [Microterricola gilva]
MPVEPRAWELVLRHIERELLDGGLQPGDHLPPERALAADLGVGRSSVREAVRVLEGFGLIRTQTGSGPSAGAIIVATPQGGMSALMRLQVAAQGFPVADIVKTRLLLETQIASGLAESSPAPSLAAATTLLAAMDADGLTPAEFLALDAQFHVALAEASGNQVVTAMMAGLRDAVESYALAGLSAIADPQRMLDRLRAEHHGIVEAIDGRDAAAAGIRIHAHIAGYYAETHSHATHEETPTW